MVVFSKNSKRIRRPSVRLWEVGDLPAAFTCGISKLNNETTGQKKWKSDSQVQNSESLNIAIQKQLEYTILDLGVSPRTLEDCQHNRENRDPNSSKPVSEFAISDDKNKSKSKLDFGAVTRRSRMMKRRRRNPDSISSLFCPWKSEPGCEISSGDDKSCEWKQHIGSTLDTGFNIYCVNGLKVSVDNETSATSKDACDNEIDDQNFSNKIPNETWPEATWSEENTTFPQSTYGRNNEVSSDSNANSVREWLKELGFGKFACLFDSQVQNSESLNISVQKQLEYTILDLGVSPRTLEGCQRNRENRDPNSSKLVSEFAISDDKNKSKSKLDFGAVTRRSRMMKRRRRNPDSISSLFCPWKSEPGCEISSGDDKSCAWKQHIGSTLDAGFNISCLNGLKVSEDNETSAMSKDACDNEIDDQNFSNKIPNETWPEATWSEENTTFPQSTYGRNNEVSSDNNANSVREWLKELGFGQFACLFEMHAVDKETLPLLTFEDLKDMGIDAIGPRRKLFTAIQHLRQGK